MPQSVEQIERAESWESSDGGDRNQECISDIKVNNGGVKG